MPHPVPHRWDSSGEEHTLRSLIPPHGLYTHTNNRVKKFYVVFEILPREVGEGGGVNKFTMKGVLVTYKKKSFYSKCFTSFTFKVRTFKFGE